MEASHLISLRLDLISAMETFIMPSWQGDSKISTQHSVFSESFVSSLYVFICTFVLFLQERSGSCVCTDEHVSACTRL